MKLSKIVNIDNWFSRSINIERDGSSLDAVTAYVPTSTTIKTLRSIAKAFTKENIIEHGHSLVLTVQENRRLLYFSMLLFKTNLQNSTNRPYQNLRKRMLN